MRHLLLFRQLFPWYSLAAVVFACILSWWLSGSIWLSLAVLAPLIITAIVFHEKFIHPLLSIKEGLERFTGGDLSSRISIDRSLELWRLAESANDMAARLGEQMQAVTQQRNEQALVLSSMLEAVLAIDRDERILRINRAAGMLLGVDPQEAVGCAVQEVVRSAVLQRFINKTFASQEPIEEEVVWGQEDKERIFQAYGRSLNDPAGSYMGILVVLNEVTRLRHLEEMRREFVANVSHELKTPVTSIKGFCETLLDGAVEQPDDARRFLDIIMRQADRLNAIFEDLLSLSRIERDRERGEIRIESCGVARVLHDAIETCRFQANERKIKIQLNCPQDLVAPLNPTLLEQAAVNLIDNAIKYSNPEQTVDVTAEQLGAWVGISVRDRGRGIDKPHLSRVFERFYRVDKARSRLEGGTGLGLAIVKHIAQAHGGYASVESSLGQGSIFTIHLPAEERAAIPRTAENGLTQRQV